MTIRLTGSFAVLHGGDRPGSDASGPIGSRKGRRLLARLAATHPRVLTVDDIVADLWPQASPQRPADNVATLVSRLRATRGAGVVLGGRAGYRLGDPPAVEVDLHRAAALAGEAGRQVDAREPALAAAAARQGLALLGGGQVLVGEQADWVDTVRSETAALLRTLRHCFATAALAAGDPRAAIPVARAAASDDPLDDRAHRLLMAAHQADGEPGLALAVFERLRSVLATELGADPAPETRALHVAVLRGERVGTAPAPPATARRRTKVLAGRDAELDRLTAAWSAAAAGPAALLLVTGEAGIGTTTLAEAVVALAADTGGLVLSARCCAAERSLLLQPVLDALGSQVRAMPAATARRLAGPGAGVLAGLMPAAAGVLGEPDTARGSPEMEHRRVYDAVGGFVRALAADRPVLLMLNDLHNAGVATVELLHYLAARPAGARLLVLATVRTEEGAEAIDALADVATRVEVGPLAPDAVALLAARAGATRLAEDILRRTLFVVETLRGIAVGEDGVPESLQAAVLARMRRVGPDVEHVLRAGAVLGAAVGPDTVAAMLDLPVTDVLDRCAEAAAARLLVASSVGTPSTAPDRTHPTTTSCWSGTGSSRLLPRRRWRRAPTTSSGWPPRTRP